jgi:hypothetical protein
MDRDREPCAVVWRGSAPTTATPIAAVPASRAKSTVKSPAVAGASRLAPAMLPRYLLVRNIPGGHPDVGLPDVVEGSELKRHGEADPCTRDRQCDDHQQQWEPGGIDYEWHQSTRTSAIPVMAGSRNPTRSASRPPSTASGEDATVSSPDAHLRAELLGSHLMGLALAHYVNPPRTTRLHLRRHRRRLGGANPPALSHRPIPAAERDQVRARLPRIRRTHLPDAAYLGDLAHMSCMSRRRRDVITA